MYYSIIFIWRNRLVLTSIEVAVSYAKMSSDYCRKYPHFQGVSFETIAAFGKNAAVIHYRAENSTDALIDTNSVFLLDSGGQYL